MSTQKQSQGLLMVHTGEGKGKTTAAIGMLVRSLGHGHKCAVVQFIKGPQPTAETLLAGFAESLGGSLAWDRCGEGFTWRSKDHTRDRELAAQGWSRVREHLADPELRFLLLDELNIVLNYHFLDTDTVLAELQARQPQLHVVVTGRGAPESLMEAADLVTEMKEHKHPFRAGIKAQAGLEF
nr:cob(I)yrinic acid a,c-diamide adenosyltransferase [uncultured Holophaga sp.]